MTVRELKIKTNVVKRFNKELALYHKEADDQRLKIDQMITDKADEYDIKKQKEVLAETLAIIPDVRNKLQIAYRELTEMTTNPAYEGTQELVEAKDVLEQVEV
ncbi:uncharacterized protein VTP21DRAFT_2071 [Calcarisporiella thermophila]|uniref:uncharacterized protein n=1 Tax=Calcarisporiella thermophila TaxID=911321 RepID=UPI003742D118